MCGGVLALCKAVLQSVVKRTAFHRARRGVAVLRPVVRHAARGAAKAHQAAARERKPGLLRNVPPLSLIHI